MSNGPRLLYADRSQLHWDSIDLESQLPAEHMARIVWAYVLTLDVSELEKPIKARDDQPGRPTLDRRIYLALWLYATLQGVGSARQLDRLCRSDTAYRWILGGCPVNYHDLADFRTEAAAFLDDLLSKSVAALAHQKLVSLDCLAVDGLRVRAAAGRGSFRRRTRLKQLHAAAREKVAALRAELQEDAGASERRQQERKLRAAEDLARRVEAASKAAEAIEQERAKEAKEQRRKEVKGKEPRASTTDADARIMKMPDGGRQPAYNVQFKSDPSSGILVGVSVTNRASDRGQLGPAVQEIEDRYEQRPKRLLADGGYDGKRDIERLFDREKGVVEVYCPVPGSKGKPVPAAPKRGEGSGVIAWRERMSTEAAYEIYDQRIKAERAHAHMRNRGLRQLLVRGLEKAKAVVLWQVTAYNFMQTRFLLAKAAAG